MIDKLLAVWGAVAPMELVEPMTVAPGPVSLLRASGSVGVSSVILY